MKIKSEQLIGELLERCEKNINYAELLKTKSAEELNFRRGRQLECFGMPGTSEPVWRFLYP